MFKIENVIILAAGRGSRMLDLCNEIPKPLLKYNEKPLIEWIIEYFKNKKFKNIYVVTGYLSEKMNYLKEKYNINLVKNKNWESTNNISSIKCVKHLLNNSLIINGDVIIKSDCISKEYETSCTYAEKNDSINEWAIITNNKGNIIEFNKNPTNNWCGLFQREVTIISSELAKYIRSEIDYFDEQEYYEILVLETSKKYNIDFKPYIIDKNKIYDIDNKKDFLKEISIEEEQDDQYKDYVDMCSCEDK